MPSCLWRFPLPALRAAASTGRRAGIDDLVLAPERMHQGDQRGASRVRCLLLHEHLRQRLAHLGLVVGILGGPRVSREYAKDPALPGADHSACGQPLIQPVPQILAQRPDHRRRLAALVGDEGFQGRVEDFVTGWGGITDDDAARLTRLALT
jgi:hypothetical protein